MGVWIRAFVGASDGGTAIASTGALVELAGSVGMGDLTGPSVGAEDGAFRKKRLAASGIIKT